MTHLSAPVKSWRVNVKVDLDAGARFIAAIRQIAQDHDPSKSAFFQYLRDLPDEVAGDPELLGQIHLVYQSAMHATRAAVYYLPHLDSPEMRKRKLRIFIDDDGLPGGDTHHYQLTRAFSHIGAKLLLDDEDFGEPSELCRYLDPETSKFVQLATTLYARSLGAHFPGMPAEPYFADCFSHGVEERHADESLEVTATVLRARPELYYETVLDAKLMAEALDGVWRRLNMIVMSAEQRSRAEKMSVVDRSRSVRREPAHGAV